MLFNHSIIQQSSESSSTTSADVDVVMSQASDETLLYALAMFNSSRQGMAAAKRMSASGVTVG
jgi:hypothetical protein